MEILEIPTSSDKPDYTQSVELDGIEYVFRFRWSTRGECWHFDLTTVAGEPIASGVRVVLGHPLLRRCLHVARPPGEIAAFDMTESGTEAGQLDLGTRVKLFYLKVA